MEIIQTKLDFMQFSPIEKVGFYRNVITKFIGNSSFPSPVVPILEASAAIDTVEKAIIAASDGTHSGSVIFKGKAIPRAGAYLYQMAKGAIPLTEEGWTLCGVSTRAEFELSGLDVMCLYYFRIAAITPDGLTDYSEPVSKIVV
jgi:hypothetical protein